MAVAAFRKIWDYLVGENDEGIDEEADNAESIYDYNEEEEEDNNSETFSVFKRKNNRDKIINMPQSQSIKMKILKPTSYDDVDGIIGELKIRNGTVMNLEYVNKDIARRIIDTVSGAVIALDGHIEKVSNAIFVIAPNNYDITNEPINKERNERSVAPWAK